MIIKENASLSMLTTIKIGGNVKKLYIPENEKELIECAKELHRRDNKLYIISGGSNILANDNRDFEAVISMEKSCTDIFCIGDGEFYVGASVRIQKVITFVNENNYGGFEELVGLPAMFGGIICMNAGIGGEKGSRFTIGKFIQSVKAYNMINNCIEEINCKDCRFSHRSSIFKNGNYVILGGTIKCNGIKKSESQKRVVERQRFCKDNFEYGKGCFGSCFSESRYKILKMCSLIYRPFEKGIHFGRKNANWLYNDGYGKYKDTTRAIDFCMKVHRLLHQKIITEVVIWD